MAMGMYAGLSRAGLPPRGGSGLKSPVAPRPRGRASLPPRGGSGLKSAVVLAGALGDWSPSARREWVEMTWLLPAMVSFPASPSARREWVEIEGFEAVPPRLQCLPPRGGSGLKFRDSTYSLGITDGLPPRGGSGLKYSKNRQGMVRIRVSLREEGVG